MSDKLIDAARAVCWFFDSQGYTNGFNQEDRARCVRDLRLALSEHEAGAKVPPNLRDMASELLEAAQHQEPVPTNEGGLRFNGIESWSDRLDRVTHVLGEILRRALPVTATPPGTVAVSEALLREVVSDIRQEGVIHGPCAAASLLRKTGDAIEALLPPAAAKVPEPTKEQVSAWEVEARQLKEWHATSSLLEKVGVVSGYVAARKAQWVKDQNNGP